MASLYYYQWLFCNVLFVLYLDRQGHLTMVVLLMSLGADPSLLDGEGQSCASLLPSICNLVLARVLFRII